MAPEQNKQSDASKRRSRRDGNKQRLDNSQQMQFHPLESMTLHDAETSHNVGDGSQNATSPHLYNNVHTQHTQTHEHLAPSTFGINYRVYQDHQHDLQGIGAQFSTPTPPTWDNPQPFTHDQRVSYLEQTTVPTGYEQTIQSNNNAGMSLAQTDVVVPCGSEGSHYSLTKGCWCGDME